MAVTYKPRALKALAATQPARAKRIMDAVNRVAAAPRAPNNNLRPLVGRPNAYRLRVGDWRVSFTLIDGDLDVFEIAPRGSAYR